MRHSNPITATLRGILDNRASRQRGTSVQLRASDRLDGKTALVTGANSGLGKATAIQLAQRGARVLMACRGGIPAAGADVRAASRSDAVQMLPVDLADPRSIRALCDDLVACGEQLDVVVCNAGCMPRASRRAPSGFELMFAVNYLANVLLIERLVADGSLRADGATLPRIVIVSSESHRSAAPLVLDEVGDYVEYGVATGMKQYAHTKLLLCTYATELSRRLAGTAAVHSLCPGPVASNIAREAPGWAKPILAGVFRAFFKTPEKAAAPVVYLSASGEIDDQTGVYLHGMMATQPADAALDPTLGAQLWERNATLVARAEAACS